MKYMRPKVEWVRYENLSVEQKRAIADKRFGQAHPDNWPKQPMPAYGFYKNSGPTWNAGDVAGWEHGRVAL